MQKQFEIFLKKLPLFEGLSDNAFRDIIAIGRIFTLPANQTLYHKGDPANSFYVIMSGGVRLIDHTPEGRTIHIKIYGIGDCFGVLCISGNYPHTHSAETIEETTICALRGEAIRDIIPTYPEIGLNIIDALVIHVHEAHARVTKQFSERVEQRLAAALLHYGKKFGTPIADGGLSLDIAISQQALADFVGTTLESINRTLNKWSKQGYVRVMRGHLDLLDVEMLDRINNGEPLGIG